MLITSYDHVGIRVTDRNQALDFYAALGFAIDPTCSDSRVAEIVNLDGIRISLICNGVPTPDGGNLLLDSVEKWPGITHAAFVVPRLADAIARFDSIGCSITEGPVDWGRRLTCFVRDPDGNVLEFNQLVANGGEAA